MQNRSKKDAKPKHKAKTKPAAAPKKKAPPVKPVAKPAPATAQPTASASAELLAVLLGANDAAKLAGSRAARKFFHHRAGGLRDQSPKHLDAILTALLKQRRVSVRYPGHMQDDPAVLEPLTLMLHKDGLYLLAQPAAYPEIYALAVGRILDITVLPEEFDYPQDWNPAEHYKSPFGLREGEESVVTLRCAPQIVRALHDRDFGDIVVEELADGQGRVTLRSAINEELTGWVLGFGELVEVLSPPELRAAVAARLAEAAARYTKGESQSN